MSGSVRFSLRIQEEQLKEIKDFANMSNSTVGSIIKESCRQFCQQTTALRINKRILDNLKDGDTQLIIFPGEWSKESKNKIKVYVQTQAYADLENLGKRTKDDVMEFFDSSIRDNSILHKGQITTTDDGMNFICFRVNLAKVYCHFSPMQITVLSVMK